MKQSQRYSPETTFETAMNPMGFPFPGKRSRLQKREIPTQC
jgi:hypothetical protein